MNGESINAEPGGAFISTALVRLWESESAKKWKLLRAAEGHFLSKHSPQWTMSEDIRRRRNVRSKLMDWTREWFRDRGVVIECVRDETNTDGFGIFEPNAPHERPPTKTL